MTATARKLSFSEADFEERPNYDNFEEGQYPGLLTDVTDAEAKTGNIGWKWIFDVEGLRFNMTTWHSAPALWKVNKTLHALGAPRLGPGEHAIDPKVLIGRSCAVTIKRNDRGYMEVTDVFPLVDAPEQPALFDLSGELPEL